MLQQQTVARHLIIKGTVQGVFFRQSMKQKATVLGITGWCRNRTDRTVEAAIYGPEDTISKMLQWAQSGPDGAVVSEVISEPIRTETAITPSSFTINETL